MISNRNTSHLLSITGLVVFLVSCFFSLGYHHPDEHFQILEFANYYLGYSSAADLTWEYEAQIRPALQPLMVVVISKAINIFANISPFTLALILRLLTAFSAWLVIVKLNKLLGKELTNPKSYNVLFFCSLLLWFEPYIFARFSSETLGSILLLWGIYLILKHSDKKLYLFGIAGLMLGFSFFIRFQIAFAIIGLLLWLLLIKKASLKKFVWLIAGGLIAAVISIYLDFLFYGSLVITPYNYFYSNIVLDKASNWGVTPWWEYFYMFFIKGIPPISLVLLFFFFIGLFRKISSLMVFIIVPFLLSHFLIGHKELRFLFPMLYPFIVIAIYGLDHLLNKNSFQKIIHYSLMVVFIINIPFLIYVMFAPAQEAISSYSYVYDYQNKHGETTIYSLNDPYYQLVGQEINFYKPKDAKTLTFDSEDELKQNLEASTPEKFLFFQKRSKLDLTLNNYEVTGKYCVIPNWLLSYNINNWQERSRIWFIYEFRRSDF